MSPASKHSSLFGEFPPVSTSEWEQQIRKDLKGSDYEQKLIWKTTEGINVKPYYRADDLETLEYLDTAPGEYPFVRGVATHNNWEVRQDIANQNPAKANSMALDIIANGADAVGFNVKEISNANDIKTLLQGIHFSDVSLHFTSASSWIEFYKLFIDFIHKGKTKVSNIKGSFNFDSLSCYLLYGKFNPSDDDNFSEAAALLNNVAENLPSFKAITVNGQYFHNAGADVIQELAFSLSSGAEYLARLTAKGLSIDAIAMHIQFVFAIGSNYFMEIAKLRAARLLWTKIVEQFNPVNADSMKMTIHAVTSFWNKTIYDPYVNMLRNTTEAMSAAIGGCNSITVLPFDSAYKKPDEFSERIARNTQLMLKNESYFDKIVDPSAGSYYLENLTGLIADAAWKLFLSVEEMGGFIQAVRNGFIKETIEKTCKQRDLDIALCKQTILGTNQFPNNDENMLGNMCPHSDVSHLGTLRQNRGSQSFEALRLSTEAYEKEGNKRPSVFLFTCGKAGTYKEKVDFVTNFFSCGGFKIITIPEFKTIEEGVIAALKSKAEIIVFCSSDDEYHKFIPVAVNQLKSSAPDLILLIAGNPLMLSDLSKETGIDDIIHKDSNVMEPLARYQHLLGII